MNLIKIRCLQLTVALIFSVLSMTHLSAADVSIFGLIKGQSFIQDNPVAPRLDDHSDPLFFERFVELDSPNAVTSATLKLPNGEVLNVELNESNDEEFEDEFDSKIEFDAVYPGGAGAEYTFTFQGVNDGEQVVTLTLAADAYPNPPRVANYDAAQMIDPAQPFTLRWDAFDGGTSDDFIAIEIEDEHFETVFESGGPGEPDGLDGTDTSVVLPVGTFAPGRVYHANILFLKLTDVDTSSYPGAIGIAGYISETEFTLRTAGIDATDTVAPTVYPTPWNYAWEVPVNSLVVFNFDEPMDTAVSIENSIAWQGLDSNDLTYSWNATGTRLFAQHSTALPLDTEISWLINPDGGDMNLRDRAGNPLPTTGGLFFTDSNSNASSPDVDKIHLIKGRGFHQFGPSPEADGNYVLELAIDLTGFNTVTNGSLTIPGGGVITPGHPFDGDLFDFEADYTFESDLNRYFPNGDYTITLDTAHNGTQAVTLSLSGDFPNAPTVANLSEAQAIDPAEPFTLSWDPFTGGTSADFIIVEIESDSDFGFSHVFESPGPGEAGALDGTATSIEIPAFTLAPGRTYGLELIFVNLTDSDAASYPGVSALAGLVSATEVQIHTTGEVIRPHLEIMSVSDSHVELQLTGERGMVYVIEATSSLSDPSWVDVAFVEASEPAEAEANLGVAFFTDGTGGLSRFYRAREADHFFGGDEGHDEEP